MNARSAIIALLLFATTAYATVSNASRAERESQVLSLLNFNVFVNPNNTVFLERFKNPTIPTFVPRPSIQDVNTEGISSVEGSRGDLNSAGAPVPVIAPGADGRGVISERKPRVPFAPRSQIQRLSRPDVRSRTVRTILDLQDLIIARGGCNRNLCFALDASTKLSPNDFQLQRDFVALIAATLGVDNDVHVASWQYGPRVRRISSLSADINAFLLRLETWQQDLVVNRNFLAGAISGCRNELRRRRNDANKLVLIGNGRTSFFQQAIAVNVANAFRRQNGAVCAVTVSNANTRFFTRLTGTSERVLGVTDFSLFDTILTDIVSDICGLP